ncbi:carbohydrate ABC transporter permease [Pseudothermotoga sp.]|nr:sugar ABC transporter permease [Pseudothermotoga sp.]MCX7812177.1 sugar ABC transporter permease [Pseudothermotoga sp.]MDW8139247.1 sugar ABC transporter permease [Pseudothermotoga sp.]
MKRYHYAWLFLLPNLLIFTIFVVTPALSSFYFSLTDYDMLRFSGRFVGLTNFQYLFSNRSDFGKVLLRTFYYSAMVVPLAFFASLFLALVTSSDLIKGKAFLRALFYWPWLLSPSIIGISWKWFLDYDAGLINILLLKFGSSPIPWLLDRKLAFLSVVIVTVWNVAGYFMVMFNSALTAIPIEVYEAAALDGANRWVRFWKIIFPLLKPTAILVIVLSTIMSMRSFEIIYVFTAGGPGTATTVLAQKIYYTAFLERKLGMASAMSIVLFGILITLSLLQFKILEEEQ